MSNPMNDPLPRDRDGLIEQARTSIYYGDRVLASADNSAYPKEQGPWGSIARAHYSRASVLIQMAGYLGAAEEGEDRKRALNAIIGDEPSLEERMRDAGYSEDERQRVLDRIERQRQDDYIAGHALAADTGGTSQRRGVHGDPWRSR